MAIDGKESTASVPKDCLPCKLVGGFGCTGAGLYVAYQASRNSHPVGRALTFMFSGALAGVGIARFFDLGPFSKPRSSPLN